MNLQAYLVIIYIITIVSISSFFIKKVINSYEEYSLAGRSLGPVYIFLTYFGTWISGGIIIGLADSSFKWGLYQYWIIAVSYCFGFITAPLFFMRIRKLKLYTIGDFFALRFPEHAKLIRILVASAIIIRNITIIGAQFSTVAFLFMITFELNFTTSLLFAAAIVVFYTALSGLRGIAATDVIQGTLQALGLPILLYFIYQQAGGWNEINSFYNNIGGNQYLNLFGGDGGLKKIAVFFITPGLYFLVDDQTTWQRIYASKNDQVAFWGYLAPICAVLLWILLPCYLGVFSKPIFPYFTAFPVALFGFILHLPVMISSIILISFISAAMSTADSYLLSCGLTFSRDIYQKVIKSSASEKELIAASRASIFAAGLFSALSCLLIYDIFDLYIAGAFLSGSMIVIPYLYTWFSKRMNAVGIIAGIIAGGSSFLFAASYLDYTNSISMLIGLACNLIFSWSFSCFGNKPSTETVMSTYYWSPKYK